MEFVIGIAVGLLLYYVFGDRKKYSGSLTIDLTMDAKEPIKLNIYEPLGDITSKKWIMLDVRVLTDDSQK